jgi:hypothetical protein
LNARWEGKQNGDRSYKSLKARNVSKKQSQVESRSNRISKAFREEQDQFSKPKKKKMKNEWAELSNFIMQEVIEHVELDLNDITLTDLTDSV